MFVGWVSVDLILNSRVFSGHSGFLPQQNPVTCHPHKIVSLSLSLSLSFYGGYLTLTNLLGTTSPPTRYHSYLTNETFHSFQIPIVFYFYFYAVLLLKGLMFLFPLMHIQTDLYAKIIEDPSVGTIHKWVKVRLCFAVGEQKQNSCIK